MVEEFHGIDHGDGTYTLQQLYGWSSMDINIWMPSLSELVGYDPNNYADWSGCYYPAMQGLNLTEQYPHVDVQGGMQFAYFKPYNTSGGGNIIWRVCNQQQVWLRTSVYANADKTWQVTNAAALDWVLPDSPRAVHPAVEKSVTCAWKRQEKEGK